MRLWVSVNWKTGDKGSNNGIDADNSDYIDHTDTQASSSESEKPSQMSLSGSRKQNAPETSRDNSEPKLKYKKECPSDKTTTQVSP